MPPEPTEKSVRAPRPPNVAPLDPKTLRLLGLVSEAKPSKRPLKLLGAIALLPLGWKLVRVLGLLLRDPVLRRLYVSLALCSIRAALLSTLSIWRSNGAAALRRIRARGFRFAGRGKGKSPT